MNRDYESMMIVGLDLDDQTRDDIFAKIIKQIKDLGGETLASKIWAKERKFYYFLQGRGAGRKKHDKGCYWLINFTLDKDKLSELKEVIRLEERILRSLIVNREVKIKSEIIG